MRIDKYFYVIIISFCGILQPPPLHAQEAEEHPGVLQAGWNFDAETDAIHFTQLSAYSSFAEQSAGFNLGFVRYRPLGYDWKYRDYRVAGLRFTDWHRGVPAWNALSGVTLTGNEINGSDRMNSVGDRSDREIHPWQLSPMGRLRLSGANRNYNFRGSAQYQSGESEKTGLAWSVLASHSWGDRLPAEGTWTDSWTFAAGISKKIGVKHRIGIDLLYAPSKRVIQTASTAEAVELTGKYLYNPNWGYYGADKRSANVRTSRQPIGILTHEFLHSEELRITTKGAVRLGQEGYTAVNWQDAPNPRPDYYRHMPSFQTSESMREKVAEMWRTDPSVSQIDWAAMTDLNRYNTPRARYILEDRIRDYREFYLHSSLEWKPTRYSTLEAGVEGMAADNLNFKKVKDLLGAEYWLDIDVFAENDDDNINGTQNNMRQPNREVKAGDRFGYHYSMVSQNGRAWINWSERRSSWSYGIHASAGGVRYRRYGYYEKENFAGEQSHGYSDWTSRGEWLARGTVGYHVGGRFYAGISVTGQSLAPTSSQLFISPEYRNATNTGIRNEKITSGDIVLDYRTPGLRIRVSAFLTEFKGKSENHRFYEDFNHYFVNYFLSGINTRHQGVELSVEYQLTDRLRLSAFGTWMNNRYRSNPTATEERESTGEFILTETVDYKGLRVSGSPQKAAVVKLEYAPRSWTVSLSMNAFGGSYIAPAPLRRTERAAGEMSSPEERAELKTQERFSGGSTFDLFVGKTFYFGEHRFGVYSGINNLFNRKSIRTGGYEAYRMRLSGTGDERRMRPLDSKYYYALGTNFYVTVSWRF